MASIRGDATEELLLARAMMFASGHNIESDADLGSYFDDPSPDTDPNVLKRLRQMYEAGGWVLVESTLADLPADLRWLYESGAVTLEQLAAMHKQLGITSAPDIAAALNSGALRTLDSLGEPAEEAIRAVLPRLRASIPRIPLGRATAITDRLLTQLRSLPGVEWALPSGSLRRGEDMVGDIEIVAPVANPTATIFGMLNEPDAVRCLHRSERRLYLLQERVQVGIRLPDPSNAGSELLYLTGSTRHLEGLAAHAATRGCRLMPAGLVGSDGRLLQARTEEEIYAALGLPCIPPELRSGDDEIAVAARNELPRLLSRDDIRGDLHMHTVWSDGRDSIDVMVDACRSLGYEYIAITDHSQTSAASRNLTVDSIKKQADDISRLRERFSDIAILHGCEVDILPDGRLDFADKILERFDIVLASLHEQAGHSPEQLMKRYVTAMRHPLVTLITHPTNRLVPHRRGYDLDYDRLFETAAETQTAVEVDGSPSHLDLDGALARRAIGKGAMVVVNGDSHRADLLERQMRLGILTARRGWVEPRHVLNTRPIDEVRAFIAAKRAGRKR